MDELLREFLTETNESIDAVDVELVRFEQEPNNKRILDNIFRLVHTIKGTCGFLSLPRLATLAHSAESLMSRFRDGMPVTGDAVTVILATIDRIKEILDIIEQTAAEPAGDDEDLIAALDAMQAAQASAPAAIAAHAGSLVYQVLERPLRPGEATLDELERAFRETPGPQPRPQTAPFAEAEDKADQKLSMKSIRVNVDTLEHLMTTVSELVLTRNQLLDIARRHGDTDFKAPLQRLSHVTGELQESVMKTRLQPIGNAWQKLPRVVRDLAADLGKQIELEMQGAETELDRQVLDRIKDPLTHMVRNSADHGLETPQERLRLGKPEKGTIRLSARQEGGQILIEVADDGRGLDVEKIRQIALTRGIANESDLAAMPDAELNKLIFAPGLSTASAITNVSGRGVGMDVVRTNIDALGGSIDVEAVRGQGTIFTIKIPLTLAIISAMLIESRGQRFAVPQLAVRELVRLHAKSEHRIERIKDAPMLRLRDRLLPLVHLGNLLRLPESDAADQERGFVVVMQIGQRNFGLLVDHIFDAQEIVVKPMSSLLRHIGAFSGNTILGDGSVIMILDPNGVAESLGAAASVGRFDIGASETNAVAALETTPLLIFRAGTQAPKAIPLSLVTRLEETASAKIENVDGGRVLQYRGQLIPIIAIDERTKARPNGVQPLLVFSDAGRSVGLLVDEIVDIVDEHLDVEIGTDRPGMIGSAVINGEATEIVDLSAFLPGGFWQGGDNAQSMRGVARSILFVAGSDFFRDLLVPVLSAAGYRVRVAGPAEACKLIKSGTPFDAALIDADIADDAGFALASAISAGPRAANTALIALATAPDEAMIARVRAAGFHDCVAKFDRPGLIAALLEQTATAQAA